MILSIRIFVMYQLFKLLVLQTPDTEIRHYYHLINKANALALSY